MTETQDLPVVPHWISGGESLSSGERTAPVFDPALGVETKRVSLASAQDIEAAIGSASKAFPAWRAVYRERCEAGCRSCRQERPACSRV